MKTEETPNPADDSTQAAQGAKADKAGAAPATASSAPMKDMEVKEGRTDPAEEATATAVDATAADLPSGSPRGRSTKRRKRQRHRRQKSQHAEKRCFSGGHTFPPLVLLFCLYQYTSLFNVFFISGCKIFFSTYAYLLFLYQLNVFCHGLFILTAGCKKYLILLRILRFCITSLILPMFFLQELFATRP